MRIADYISTNMQQGSHHPTFYHFTDGRNLPLIRKYGLLSMSEIKRRGISTPYTGGNQWSLDADIQSGMDRYVHLCFMTNNPMEHLASKEGRIADVSYLHIVPTVLRIPGVVITTDVANKSGVVPIEVCAGLEQIDADVIYRRSDWTDDGIKERRKAAHKCEVLIPDHVPVEYIRNL